MTGHSRLCGQAQCPALADCILIVPAERGDKTEELCKDILADST